MAKKKEPFNMVKVVDPHKNMPRDIASALLEGYQQNDDMMHNDSFLWWTVGNYQYVTEDLDSDELDGPGDRELKLVDDWMLENGFKKDEEVLILYWW